MTPERLAEIEAVIDGGEYHHETMFELIAAIRERDERIESLRSVLEAVRSQMCWERDRDQLTMGFRDLHDDATKALEAR